VPLGVLTRVGRLPRRDLDIDDEHVAELARLNERFSALGASPRYI
jgi:hypothetical protein